MRRDFEDDIEMEVDFILYMSSAHRLCLISSPSPSFLSANALAEIIA